MLKYRHLKESSPPTILDLCDLDLVLVLSSLLRKLFRYLFLFILDKLISETFDHGSMAMKPCHTEWAVLMLH